MENKYQIREVTSKDELCSSGCCPAIYEKTPVEDRCCSGSCSGVYETEGDTYLVIGKVVNPKDFGLEKKVGDDEGLIEIPKGIIDNKID